MSSPALNADTFAESLINADRWKWKVLIGTPSLGVVRIEWANACMNMVMPMNYSCSRVVYPVRVLTPLRYHVAEAQNLIVQAAVNDPKWEFVCFDGRTEVETESGAKYIRDIEVGDKVRTRDGSFRKVAQKHRTPIRQRDPMLWIRTKHSTIKATYNHPFMVKYIDGHLRWAQAGALFPGDKLVYPSKETGEDLLPLDIRINTADEQGLARRGRKNGQHIGDLKVDSALARFCGLYLAEGHCSRDHIGFTFSNTETEYAEFIKRMAWELFGRRCTVTGPGWSTQIRISARGLAKKFSEIFGESAKVKHIPSFVFDWKASNRLAFLKGYLDGDGHYNNNGEGHISFGSASKQLVEQVRGLAGSLGLRCGLVFEVPPKTSTIKRTGQTIQNSGSYLSTITTLSSRKFSDLVSGNPTAHYIEVLVEAVDRHVWAGSKKDSFVYNLGVEGDHTYVVGPALVHNCFLEDDVLPPPNAMTRFAQWIKHGKFPMVSGLYHLKSDPPEPMTFRGRGNGSWEGWKKGPGPLELEADLPEAVKPEEVAFCDGVPTGCLLISTKLLKVAWDESQPIVLRQERNDGSIAEIQTRDVFRTLRDAGVDPSGKGYWARYATSDLDFCDRAIKHGWLEKAGFPEAAKMEFPFPVDLAIHANHIDLETGRQF